MLNSLSLFSNHFQINKNNKHLSLACFWSKIQKRKSNNEVEIIINFLQFFMKNLTHCWSFFSILFNGLFYWFFHIFFYLQTLPSYEIHSDTASNVMLSLINIHLCEKGKNIDRMKIVCDLSENRPVSMTFMPLVLNYLQNKEKSILTKFMSNFLC